jgi:hypothetical protein
LHTSRRAFRPNFWKRAALKHLIAKNSSNRIFAGSNVLGWQGRTRRRGASFAPRNHSCTPPACRNSAFTCVSSPLDAREAADEVLLLARDQDCDTVIVGHTPQSWLSALGGGDLAEQLVRRAKGYAVWVIG